MAQSKLEILFGLALLVSVVTSLETLDLEEQLQKSEFGQPKPRHGCALLKWYVQNCVDNNMVATCVPTQGEYGFHKFNNNEILLPKIEDHKQYDYYIVGNLDSDKEIELPKDVRKYYKPNILQSNSDRVLVKYNKNSNKIDEIYVTTHFIKYSPDAEYDPLKTYRIGMNLIKILRQPSPTHNPTTGWTTVYKKNYFRCILGSYL